MSNEWNVRATNSNRGGSESGIIILSDLITIDSVLSSFSRSLLQSIHNFTPKMQFCMRWTMVSNGLDGKTQEVEC